MTRKTAKAHREKEEERKHRMNNVPPRTAPGKAPTSPQRDTASGDPHSKEPPDRVGDNISA